MRTLSATILVVIACLLAHRAAKADQSNDMVAVYCGNSESRANPTCRALSKAQDSFNKAQQILSKAKDEASKAANSPKVVNSQTRAVSMPPLREWEQDCVPLPNSLFVRADPLDNFHYLIAPVSGPASSADEKSSSSASAKGASISYTDDRQARTQSATINGRVSYLAFSRYCAAPRYHDDVPYIHAFGIAPFIDGNGTWNQPVTKSGTSSLLSGVDFVAALDVPSSWFFVPTTQYFYVSPFHKTDFRGVADANGVTFAWEPQVLALNLGIAAKSNSPYINFFWQFRTQVEWSDVSKVGYTNLTLGDHDVVATIARANFALLPQNPANDSLPPWVSDWVVGRFSIIGTVENFHDAATTRSYEYYSASLQYKLGACTTKSSSADAGGSGADTPNECTVQGSSALSLEYDWGTDINTFVSQNRYLVKLTYAY
jgi:hypothetical protein